MLVDDITEALADGRARTAKELVSALQPHVPERAVQEALDSDEAGLIMPLGDERYALLPALLHARVFTHRLTEAEVRCGFLSPSPDLEALSMLTEEERFLQLNGEELVELLPELDEDLLRERGIEDEDVQGAAWLIVPELLSQLAAGDLIAVSAGAEGFAIEPVTAGAVPDAIAAALRAWSLRLQEGPGQLDSLLWELCADDVEAFTSPLPPVAELLAAADLDWADDLVMPAGFDLGRYRTERSVDFLTELYELEDDEALAVVFLGKLYELVADGELSEFEEPEMREMVRVMLPLAYPPVAEALLDETMGMEREGAPALAAFADALEPAAPAAARPMVRWLRGRAYDRMGRPDDAEVAYEAALALEPTCIPALLDLAQLASDRGDAERGLSLLRRAGAGSDDYLFGLLERFRPVERGDLGRNEPCWCGSGRKYKVCHRGREQQPLEERAVWLYEKARAFVQAGPWRGALLEAALTRTGGDQTQEAIVDALRDPLVADAVLFEDGAFAEFLQQRGGLLPEDERLLAAQWLLVERSLYEIEDVQVGTGFTTRDLRTGERLQVKERLGSEQARVGMLICTRLVPAGDTIQAFGGIEPMELHERDQLLDLLDAEPSAAELVAAVSRRFVPPQLQNTEGEPLLLCEAVLSSPDPVQLAGALDMAYRRVDAGAVWHEYVTTHGMERIRATVSLEGSEVTVESNSEARQQRVLANLRRLQPGLDVLRDERRPLDEMPKGTTSSTELDPSHPAIAVALEQFILEQERVWLDEPVPALAGVTPRQAAADPTRREDLVRLLESYPPASAGTMDPDRLRAALGL